MEMSSKLITVVVPVYKVEQYIDKCLTSLIVPKEQLPLLEVLVVNDGTPDRSADMAREYEKRYPDVFRVIDKDNGGHGSAWNRGLKEAKGKYLRFLDSDDWFTTSEFSRLISRLGTLDVDIVLSNYNRYYVQTEETILHLMYSEKIDQSFTVGQFDWSKLSWEMLNFWGCTYRTSMLQKEYPLFMEGVYYDDAILFIAPVMLSKTIHVFDATIYNYLIGRPGQTMAPEVRKKYLDAWAKTHFQVFDFGIKHCPDISEPGVKSYVYAIFRDWLHDSLVRFSDLPFKQSKAMTDEWNQYFTQIKQICPDISQATLTIRIYQTLPFPLYFFIRRIISLFSPPNYH